MKRGGEKLRTLISLNLAFIIQKTTIIIYLIGIILTGLCLFFIANPFMDPYTYLANSNDIHISYFNQSLFILELFNSIIIIAIIININISSNSFDSLFISYTPRGKIIISKIISLALINLIIVIIDSLILFGIPLILYSNYVLSFESLKIILFLYIIIFFESSIAMMLSGIIQSLFVPILVSFTAIVFRVMCMNFTIISNTLKSYLPIIKISTTVTCDAFIPAIIWSILTLIIYYSIYSIKDIRY